MVIALGTCFILVVLVVVCYGAWRRDGSPLPEEVLTILRIVLALGAGLVSAGFAGFINVQGTVAGLALQGGGGGAVFLVVYLVNPPRIAASAASSASPRMKETPLQRPTLPEGSSAMRSMAFADLAEYARQVDEELLVAVRDRTFATESNLLAFFASTVTRQRDPYRFSANQVVGFLNEVVHGHVCLQAVPDPDLLVCVSDGFTEVVFRDAHNKTSMVRIASPDLLWDCHCNSPGSQNGHRHPPSECPIHGNPYGAHIAELFGNGLVEISFRGLSFLWRNQDQYWPPSVDAFHMVHDLESAHVFDRRHSSVLDIGCGTGFLGMVSAIACRTIVQVGLSEWLLTPLLYSAANFTRNRERMRPGVAAELRLTLNVPEVRRPYDLVLCNPPYLPTLGFKEMEVMQAVAGTELLEKLIRDRATIGRYVYVNFSRIAQPEASQVARALRRRLAPIAQPHMVPFRVPIAFSVPGYMAQLMAEGERGLRVDPEHRHTFWHEVQTYEVK